MSESKTHFKLVLLMKEFIENHINEIRREFIKVDSYYSDKKPPKTIENCIPDIYYEYNNLLIIGEAKTLNDFDRDHSIDQYKSYLMTCKSYYGESLFVLSVPFEIYISAKNLIRRIKKSNYYKTKVIIIDEYCRVSEL